MTARIVGLWVILLTASYLTACEKDKPKKVRVSVVVILASEKDTKVEKKLTAIAKEVGKTHPKLKGFKSENVTDKSLAVGVVEKFDLINDEKAAITIVHGADKDDRICLKIGPPLMGEITYSTPCGKFLPILTPLRTKNNEHVLIAVRVQPCKGGTK
jgi:hypothetical protein